MSEPNEYGDELLPEQTADDTDRRWGESPERDDDHLIREKPPHY